MKRNERTTLNQLKKTVNENTLRVEVPADFSIEARQAIHELLTIEKHMIAVGYYWDPITDTERVNYIKAWEGSEGAQRERMSQEVTPIKEEPDSSWLLCGGECSSCACRGLGCWQAKRGDVIAFRKH